MAGYLAREKQVAIEAVRLACKSSRAVFKHLIEGETLTKGDKSPVTVGDFSAQAIVNSILERNFPQDPIVGEEDSKDLAGDQGSQLRQKVVELTNSVLESPLTEDQMLRAIDRGKYQGGSKGRFWTLDPIDGTKGFLRGEQFAVCLALIEDGVVRLGVMGCPNLPHHIDKPDGPRGSIFVAVEGQGAYWRPLDSADLAETPVKVSGVTDVSAASFCESVESGHSSQSDAAQIALRLGITRPSVRMDSQCKYAAVARGDADIYLRLPVSESYVEKIWDHAAGSLIVTEAGGKVSDIFGNPLNFSQGRLLSKNKGVIAANAAIFDLVLAAVGQQLDI